VSRRLRARARGQSARPHRQWESRLDQPRSATSANQDRTQSGTAQCDEPLAGMLVKCMRICRSWRAWACGGPRPRRMQRRAGRGCWPGRARMQRRGRLARLTPGGPEAWQLAERELGACCQPAPGGAGVLDPWGAAPAPVTMLWPSGEVARKRTREVCPASVATGVSAGYRHSSMAFVEYPTARVTALTLGAATAPRRALPARCPPRASVPREGAGPTGCPGGGLRRARGRRTVAGHKLVGVAAPGERADLALRVHRAHRRPGQRVPDPARPRRPPPRRSHPPGLRVSRFHAGDAAVGWHPCGAPPRTLVALRGGSSHRTSQRSAAPRVVTLRAAVSCQK